MIYAVGIDLVEVKRIDKIMEKWSDKFISRVYSPEEIDYCAKKAYPAIHYAARFAAKEAFLKSMGIGIGNGISLKSISVYNIHGGKPELKLHRKAADIMSDNGITKAHLSISHTHNYATAVVILEK
jgi:holo-[acyl-carrier protein] synthase